MERRELEIGQPLDRPAVGTVGVAVRVQHLAPPALVLEQLVDVQVLGTGLLEQSDRLAGGGETRCPDRGILVLE